jgi:hypothetical protein
MLTESRRSVSLVMLTNFLRRLDKGFSVRGAWAAANSSPVVKTKHNIRTFPINQLRFLFIKASFNASYTDSPEKDFYSQTLLILTTLPKNQQHPVIAFKFRIYCMNEGIYTPFHML